MSVSTAKFTLEQYEHMVECGAFGYPREMKVELLQGDIVEMSPIGFQHANAVKMLLEWSFRSIDLASIAIQSQSPIRIPQDDSEPEPDIAWIVQKQYTQHPNPDEVLLVIEVADTSLEVDRGAKLAAYAQAVIGDYWIVNLVERQIEVYREPQGNGYASRQIHTVNDEGPKPLVLPEVSLDVKGLMPSQ